MEPYEDGYFDREVCKPFYHQGNGNAILLVHGFTGTCAHMRKLADELALRGHTVRTINLPGHALTEADMAKSTWQQWLHAVKEACFEMMQEAECLTVCGVSMGGVLALIAAQQMKVDACIPISAPMAVKNRLFPLAGLLAPFVPRIAWHTGNSSHTRRDPMYDIGYPGFPSAKAVDLNRLIRLARQNLFNITCPILCVQSETDPLIWKGSADEILENVGSEVRQKLILKDAPHVAIISPDLPVITDAVDALMQRVYQEKST